TYKTDQYAGALAMLQEMPTLVTAFNQSKQQYEAKILQLTPTKSGTGPYAVADGHLRRIMTMHRDMMTGLQYNFNESIHTGWPQREILAHVSRMQDALEEIDANKPAIKYPASAYYQSCLSCARDFLDSQRDFVDEYNIKTQESDKHSNDYYRQCLNQYNNCMVSFYNQFTDAAASDGWSAVHIAPVTPAFSFKTTHLPPDKTIKVFQDAETPPVSVVTQSKVISDRTAAAMNTLVQFTNECTRRNNNLLAALRNNGIHYSPFPEKNALYFNVEAQALPLSNLAEAERQSRHIPEASRATLLAQARQLMDISIEMDGLRQALTDFSTEKRWKSEGFAPVERIRDRYVALFQIFDQKKEQLYADIAQVYAAYQPAAAGTSWQRSYAALTDVVKADKTLVSSARAQWSQKTQTLVLPHEAVENASVKSIQDEFTNLKGIEKLGRYNGLCPYTPYEDVGLSSRRLAGYGKAPERQKPADFTYLYNNIIDDYNHFVALSGQPFLKNTRALDLFLPEPPPSYQRNTTPVAAPKPPGAETPKPVASTEKPMRDTIYIRDTIYLEKPPVVGEKFYSLNGFADNNLVFLLDMSASMKMENRLSLLQSSIARLVGLLREQDDIAVVGFSGKGKLLLPSTSGKDKSQILTTIQGLKPEGSTNIEEGLKMAFQTARQNFKKNGNNRIVLATDGDFTLTQASLERIRQHAEVGISLSVFKFGSKPGQNLKAISENGRGNLISITPENAEIFMIKEAQK
ncbi:MAG: VWA domain-containing protein, partial [Saprospiraceae bacterium]|nr:VWA domain-containing protein [Saprospiraceae bacterium]